MTVDLSRDDINSLLTECREKLDAVEADLIAFEDGKIPASAEFVNRVFRGFHGVKGAAGYLGYRPLEQLSHAAEGVLSEARDGRLTFSVAHSEALVAVVDRMRQMLVENESSSHVEFSAELDSLNAILGQPVKATSPEEKPDRRLDSPVALIDPPHLRRLRVLVVEDDFVSRVLLQGLLSKYGECHIAVNGREAVDAFRVALDSGQGYDVICMDIKMPEMDGPAALEQIREIEASHNIYLTRARIFMTTSVRDMRTIVGAFKLICDAYLFKPIDGAKLEDHLRAFGLIARERVRV